MGSKANNDGTVKKAGTRRSARGYPDGSNNESSETEDQVIAKRLAEILIELRTLNEKINGCWIMPYLPSMTGTGITIPSYPPSDVTITYLQAPELQPWEMEKVTPVVHPDLDHGFAITVDSSTGLLHVDQKLLYGVSNEG